jgi:hypothetical protein
LALGLSPPSSAGRVSDAVIAPAAANDARTRIHIPLMYTFSGADNSFEGYRQPTQESLAILHA